MAFDDIPEDFEESFECECGGSITQDFEEGLDSWSCDNCSKVFTEKENDE